MSFVRIVTDSTADLPVSIVQDYGITIVPLKVFFGEEVYLDGVTLHNREFYQKMAASKNLPTTSQPSPAEFVAHYEPLIKEGAEIISIHISSAMSGTIQSALLAKTMLNYNGLEIIDSLTVSIGLGQMVLAAARAAREGRTKEDIISLVRDIMADQQVFFMADTLDNLQRGGRIGKAQAFFGSLLNIKPVLTFKDGYVYPREKVRGRLKAMDRLAQIAYERVQSSPVQCMLVHSNDLAAIKQLQDKMLARLNISELIICELGPVVGTHGGPGIVGFATIG